MPLTTYVAGDVLTAQSLNDNFTFAAGGSGVVQVKSVTKSDTFTSASTSFVDVTDLSVSITPTSATNKVLVLVQFSGLNAVGAAFCDFRVMRDAVAVAVGDAAGNRQPASGRLFSTDAADVLNVPVTFLDSPATTSATIYKIQGRSGTATSFFVNRSVTDTNSSAFIRTVSTITVMEVTP